MCEEPCDKYLDAERGSLTGDGSQESPFRSFLQVQEWTSTCGSSSTCHLRLFVLPGIYQAYPISSDLPLQIIGWIDDLPEERNETKVTVVVNELAFVEAERNCTITNVEFVNGATNNKTDFPIIFCASICVLENVTFAAIRRTWPLIETDASSTLYLTRVRAFNCAITSLNAPTAAGGIILVAFANVVISDSLFFSNTLFAAYSRPTTEFIAASVLMATKTSHVTITGTTFKNNSVVRLQSSLKEDGIESVEVEDKKASCDTEIGNCADTNRDAGAGAQIESEQKFYVGAVAIEGAKVLRVEECLFEENFHDNLLAKSANAAGGGLTALNVLNHFFLDSRFIRNSGAAGAGFLIATTSRKIDSTSVISVVCDEVELDYNSCYHVGCGALVTSSEPIDVFFTNSIAMGNFLSPQKTLPIMGGSAIAVIVDTTTPIESSLKVYSSAFYSNALFEREASLGGGSSILSYGVLHLEIETSRFMNDILDKAHGSIWARSFRSAAILRSIFTGASFSSEHRGATFLDLSSSLNFFIVPKWTIRIVGCNFSDTYAKTFLSVTHTDTVLVEDVRIDFPHPVSLPSSLFDLKTFSISNVPDKFSIINSFVEAVGPSHIEEVGQAIIQNSTFVTPRSWYKSDGLLPWVFKYSDTPYIEITSTRFDMLGQAGAIRTFGGTLKVNGLEVYGASVATLSGAAISAEQTVLDMRNSVFANCSASVGGAVAVRDGKVLMAYSNFLSNRATKRGGAIAIAGTGSIETSTFTDNLVESKDPNTRAQGGAIFLDQPSSAAPQKSDPTSFNEQGKRGQPSPFELCPLIFSSRGGYRISGCNFVQNMATDGGAVYSRNRDSLLVKGGTSFEFNNATSRGGAIYSELGTLSVRHGRFYHNSASPFSKRLDVLSIIYSRQFSGPRPTDSLEGSKLISESDGLGGAVYAYTGIYCSLSNRFSNNSASTAGGAVYVSDPIGSSMAQDEFFSNLALIGGAVYHGKSDNSETSNTDLDGLIFEENGAQFGGAISSQLDSHSFLSNSEFKRNWAYAYGGAIYTYNNRNEYLGYYRIKFIDNSARVAGGTFFYNAFVKSIEAKKKPIVFCDIDKCSIRANFSNTRFSPSWGPLWASSGWKTSFSLPIAKPIGPESSFSEHQSKTSSTSETLVENIYVLNDARKGSTESSFAPNDTKPELYALSYRILASFVDLYGQKPVDEFTVGGTLEYECDNQNTPSSASECPYSALLESGWNSVGINIQVSSTVLSPLSPYPVGGNSNSQKSKSSSVGLRWAPMNLTLTLTDPEGDANALLFKTLHLNTLQRYCPPSMGLIQTLETGAAQCQTCPINSYNIDGDGFCYSCLQNSSSKPNCIGGTVSFNSGYWAATLPNSNEIYTSTCKPGYCLSGSCARYHTGFECAECVEGSFKSLFSRCSPSICERKSLVVAIGWLIGIVFCTMALHVSIVRWPSRAMFFVSTSQFALAILVPYLDWSIPESSTSLAQLLCIVRMPSSKTAAIDRSFLTTFAPYVSIIALWSLCAIGLAVSYLPCLSKYLKKWRQEGSSLDWKRVAATSFTILYILASSSLQSSAQWMRCKKTILGTHWRHDPSITCDDDFAGSRAVFLSISLPLSLLPLVASFAYLLVRDFVKKWPTPFGPESDYLRRSQRKILVHKLLPRSKRFLHLFFISSNCYRSRWWPYIDIVMLKIAVPVILSTFPYGGDVAILPLCFAATLLLSTIFAIFSERWTQYSATATLGALAVLAATREDLVLKTWASLAALGAYSAYFTALLVLFVVKGDGEVAKTRKIAQVAETTE